MFKKLLSTTLLSIALSTSIYAEPSDINTENLVMDDMGTFLVKKLNLSAEEAKQSADKLYKKGHSIFSQKGKMQKLRLTDGTTIEFPESSNQRKAMKYLIAAGMLGHPKAAVEAMAWLNLDAFLPESKLYRYALAEQLHKEGYLYGSYTLGLGYVNGNGISKNRDLALYYLGVVRDYCKNPTNEVYQSLAIDKYSSDDADIVKEGKRRCHLANSFYMHTKNTTFISTTPITDKVKFDNAMRQKIKDALINKQNKAIEDYIKEQGTLPDGTQISN